MLGKLITGDVKLNNLSGPISIAQGWNVSGVWVDLLSDVPALISVNLGIINLFLYPYWMGTSAVFSD